MKVIKHSRTGQQLHHSPEIEAALGLILHHPNVVDVFSALSIRGDSLSWAEQGEAISAGCAQTVAGSHEWSTVLIMGE